MEFNFKMCGLVLHQNSHHLGLYFRQVKTVIDIHTTATTGSVCCRFSSFTEPPSVERNLTMDQRPVSIFKNHQLSLKESILDMESKNAHSQQHAWGYLVKKHYQELYLQSKNLRWDGFSGCRPPSSRQCLNCWLFFCAALTLSYERPELQG